MKKKIFILIMILFLTTGCDTTYNFILDEETITESLQIINKDKSTWNDFKLFRDGKSNDVYAVHLYETDRYDRDDELGVTYSEDMSFINYIHSLSMVYYGIELMGEANYNYDDEKIVLEINSLDRIYAKYETLKNLTIKVQTNHEIISHNADEIKNNAYYFYITKENANNKNIKLEISREFDKNIKITEESNSKDIKNINKNEEGSFSQKALIYSYIILSILLFVCSIVIFIKIKNSNK